MKERYDTKTQHGWIEDGSIHIEEEQLEGFPPRVRPYGWLKELAVVFDPWIPNMDASNPYIVEVTIRTHHGEEVAGYSLWARLADADEGGAAGLVEAWGKKVTP